MGAPGLCGGPRGLPLDRHGLLMKVFETPGLFGRARNLQPARGGVLDGG
ncbi:MAG: hypothetical protein U1E18_16340 [Brevundimonas sp.]|nr:hypothetical protein [Brevundimonas sp.]MDP3081811.1 hypothetical protein [Brevundimonas sp.]MDZ4111154.1 hypothetical protein [Brevundimonas sp.]